ncbi:MAG: hypothetical protein ACOXZ6_04085 [Syntrophomonadaceae bacterium]|jgi:hypothetical protein
MKKLACLLITLFLSLAPISMAQADQPKDLVDWMPEYLSSDPPGTYDYLDPGNPNSPADIGSLECRLNGTNYLEFTISNGYPGYQAWVDAEVTNISGKPVECVGIELIDKPECILVAVTDRDGQSLQNKTLDKNSQQSIRVITRIRQNADRASEYRFQIKLIYQQTGGGPPDDPPDPPYDPPDPPYDPPDDPPYDPPYDPPDDPFSKKEVTVLPEPPAGALSLADALDELPLTGGNMLLFLGIGSCLGGVGALIRKIGK